jgi:hypothetical protein
VCPIKKAKAERSQQGEAAKGVRLRLGEAVAPELHGHADPDALRRHEVLFVGNLVTFERMADIRGPAGSRSLLAYAAGFKGSARRLRSREGCRLYLQAATLGVGLAEDQAADGITRLQAWLFDEAPLPVAFFGDLDFAGLQILTSPREVFAGAVAWRPGYQVLLHRLQAGGGHLPEQAAKTQQVDPDAVGCAYADQVLLRVLRDHGRFVDQGAF